MAWAKSRLTSTKIGAMQLGKHREEQNPQPRFSSHTRGLDVFFFLLRKDAPSHHPGIAGHRGNAYGKVKGEKGRSHGRNQSYGEEFPGKARKASMRRIVAVSSQPPAYPR